MRPHRRSRAALLARRRVQWGVLALEVGLAMAFAAVLIGAHEYQAPRTAALLKRNAELSQKEGKTADAVASLRLYAAMNPDDFDAQESLAKLLAKFGDPRADQEANNRLRQLLRRAPDRPVAKAALLELSLRMDDLPEASRQAEELEKLNPADAPWLAMAQLFQSRNDNEKAARAFEKALDADPKALEVYQRYADHLVISLRDPSKAARLVATMLAKNPGNPMADLVAHVVRRDHGMSDADAALDLALQHGPDNVEVLLMAAGREIDRAPSKARAYLEKARKIKPNDVRIYLVLGKLLVAKRDYSSALTQFEDGFAKSNRSDPELAWRAAELLVELRRPQALPKYLAALARHARFRPVQAFLKARLDSLEGKSAQARDGYLIAKAALDAPLMQGAPADYRREIACKIELGLAGALVQTGNPVDALAAANRARDLAPNDPLAWLTLGGIHQLNRQFVDAAEAYRTALSKFGCPPLAQFNLAQVLLFHQMTLPVDERDYKELIGALDVVERTMPNLPELSQLKADYALAIGRPAEAIDALRAGVQLHPSNVGVALSLVRTLHFAGKDADALQTAARLEAKFGRSVASATSIAQIELDRNQPNAAVDLLEATIGASAERFLEELRLPLAQSRWVLGDVAGAAKEYVQLASADDADHFHRTAYFDFSLAENGPAEAGRLLDSQADADPAYRAWAKVWLATCDDGQPPARVALTIRDQLETLKRLRPFWWGTMEVEALVEEIEGDPIRAIRLYRRAFSAGPAYAFVVDRMMQLQFKHRRVADATDFLNQLRLQRMPRPSDQCLRIDLLGAQGKSAEALKLAQELAGKYPGKVSWSRWVDRLRENSK